MMKLFINIGAGNRQQFSKTNQLVVSIIASPIQGDEDGYLWVNNITFKYL